MAGRGVDEDKCVRREKEGWKENERMKARGSDETKQTKKKRRKEMNAGPR